MNRNELNPTERFSSRVDDYAKYRPSYPIELVDCLDSRVGGLRERSVADIGSGTGIFSRLLLERKAEVFAVEPNEDMAKVAIDSSFEDKRFHFVKGTAEATGLVNASIDLVTCAQAFHWFDIPKTRNEFNRILRPVSFVALFWNSLTPEQPFNHEYDQIKASLCGDIFEKISELTGKLSVEFPLFFGSAGYEEKFFDNYQVLDREGLVGRFFSSSYAPLPKTDQGLVAIQRLHTLFEKYQKNGLVKIEYKTELYFGS